MGAFGERLRREREMRGITLDEISESTKISRRHLESLEREDFDALPGGIFNKGFVRAYARYLGLDEDQAVVDYSSASAEQPPPPDQFPLEVHEKPNREMNPRRSSVPLVLALLALLVVLAVFWARNRGHRSEAPANAAPPVAAADSQQAAPAPSATPEPTAITPDSVGPTHTPAAVVPVAEHTFVVVIKAKEDSWVSLTADGKKTWEGTLKADNKRLVRAAKRIIVTTGNAGGIEISHNGRALGALGSESERRTLTFNPGGLVQ
ncbi:MAG TPA: helix-turn-helix domain-containing protein [Candidatus Angelobacter sp.]|nr:helix-turn-helix domain-containing protein [Candidatus Angelobacter sp.]